MYAGSRSPSCFRSVCANPISIELDLLIDAALKKKQFVSDLPQIAGTISTLTAVLKKSICREIRARKVAGTDVRPCDDDFTAFVCGQNFAIFIGYKNLGTRHRVSHRQRRIFFQNRMIDAYGGGGHSCLGRAIGIPNLRAGKPSQQARGGLRGECFAAKEETPHA